MVKEQMKKAYQLKVALKNVKPPVWCRCIVPSGITFSHLGILLMVITGGQETEAFEFEFYQKKVRLFEEQRVASRGADFYYDFRGAFETFIDELLDTQEWFSLNYSSGKSYRITIENRIEDFADAWASVQKYKGEWLLHAQTVLTDVEQINEILKEWYAISYGEPDFRTSQQIQEEIKQGKYGLQGADKAISKTDHFKKSTDGMFREFAEKIVSNCFMNQDKQIFKKQSLKSFLALESKEELKYYAQELGIQRYSGFNKSELAEKIVNHILSPSVMK